MKLGHTPMSAGHWYWSKWLTSPPLSLAVQAQLNKTAVQIFFEWPFSIIAGFAFSMPPAVHSLSCPFINSVSKYNQVQLLLSIRWTGFPSETSSRPKGCIYLPSILAGLHHSLFVPAHCRCQVLTDASSFPLFSASHFSAFFSPLFVLLLSAQSGHSLKEACLCFSQAHSYLVAPLFSFPLPLFSWIPQGNLLLSQTSLFLSCWPLSISPHQFKTLPRYCQSFWSLIVSTVFFAQHCLKDI